MGKKGKAWILVFIVVGILVAVVIVNNNYKKNSEEIAGNNQGEVFTEEENYRPQIIETPEEETKNNSKLYWGRQEGDYGAVWNNQEGDNLVLQDNRGNFALIQSYIGY